MKRVTKTMRNFVMTKVKMAQQNKTVKGSQSKRVTELEAELIGNDWDNEKEIETGRAHYAPTKKGERSKWDITVNKGQKQFYVQQGLRMRHPEHVLNQYEGFKASTTKVTDAWERALRDEEERTVMPEEYRVKGVDKGMSTNQLGLVSVADKNFKARKGRLDRQMLAGV